MFKMIEETIIDNFIIFEKRERAKYELFSPKKRQKFIWGLDKTIFINNCIQEINEPISSYLIIKSKLMQVKCPYDCYVISIMQNLDGQILTLDNALKATFGLGPVLISCVHGKIAYFEDERYIGAPRRYLLIK